MRLWRPTIGMLVLVFTAVLLTACGGAGESVDPVQLGGPHIAGAFEQSQLATEHSRLGADAAQSGDLDGARQHAEHVINIIVGENSGDQFGVAFGDQDNNGTAENPGDGVGVWPYTNDAIMQIDTVIVGTSFDAEAKNRLGEARQCLVNLREQMKLALADAQSVLGAADTTAMMPLADTMVKHANDGTNGVDADGDGNIALTAGECGAQQALDIVSSYAPALLAPSE
jgi:hypothetical protein